MKTYQENEINITQIAEQNCFVMQTTDKLLEYVQDWKIFRARNFF